MKLTPIVPPVTDTGLRALVLWDADGIVTYGEMPSGLAPISTVAGGIYVRIIGRKVTLSLVAARATTSVHRIDMPASLMPNKLYPQVSIGIAGATAKIGARSIYMSGLPAAGVNLPDSTGTYALPITWETDKPIPNPIPGIPA